MKDEKLWRALFVGWAVVVTTLSLAPPQMLPPTFGLSDILQHAVSYAVGGACAALGWSRPRAAAWAALAALALGGALEIVQAMLTAGRSGEWHDLVADAAGVVIGAVTATLLRRAWRKFQFTEH